MASSRSHLYARAQFDLPPSAFVVVPNRGMMRRHRDVPMRSQPQQCAALCSIIQERNRFRFHCSEVSNDRLYMALCSIKSKCQCQVPVPCI